MPRFLILAAVGLAAQGASAAATGPPVDFLWTAPLIILAAILIAWGAEAAQFMVSQGLALAILAWLQTLPEFAVEAEIAWGAGKGRNPISEMTANFTGSIRLLMGLGMPLVFIIFAIANRKKRLRSINLEPLQSVEIVALFPPVIYFFFMFYKGRMEILDSVVLLGFYAMYMGLLLKLPPEEEGESIEDLPAVSRLVLRQGKVGRVVGIVLIFLLGGLVLYLCVHHFVNSLRGLAVAAGIPTYFFIQWVAPFLSEFPESASALNWARHEKKASMSLMNFVSSNLSQMTLLVAMIPLTYSASVGRITEIPLAAAQREEVLLTACQAALCMVLLFNMKFEWWDAAGMFALWAAQFFVPSLRDSIVWAYLGWIALEIFLAMIGFRKWSFPLRLGKDTRFLRHA